MKTRNAIIQFLIKFGTVNCSQLSPAIPANVISAMLSVMCHEGELEVSVHGSLGILTTYRLAKRGTDFLKYADPITYIKMMTSASAKEI